METNHSETGYFKSSLEHRIRNWLVIQRYRMIFRYRLPKRFVMITLLGIERTLTFLKIIN
jgi:hypothetical protein